LISNLHTHTNFCDGRNTAEEMVLYAIDRGFDSLGFSGHGYTPFDLSFCVNDMGAYISEVKRLKEKYKGKIEIYLGVEEDAQYPQERVFDYVLGSSHYFLIGNEYYPVDKDAESFKEALMLFGGDILKLADSYYSRFFEYIRKYKPDIVGHFDLILKYEEKNPMGFLESNEYFSLADKYVREVNKQGVMFEVNTGAIARGYRTMPYPHEKLLHTLKKEGGKLTITSDCHDVKKLDFYFDETRKLLRDIGFEYVYVLKENTFKKDYL